MPILKSQPFPSKNFKPISKPVAERTEEDAFKPTEIAEASIFKRPSISTDAL